MTPEEINKRIAEWSGWKKENRGWRSPEGVFYFDEPSFESLALIPQYPDYFHTNAAMDLLGVLVERGYAVSMCSVHRVPEHLPQLLPPGWMACIELDGLPIVDTLGDTIPAAICHAIMELIEREGK